jgi:hypothetical protein
MRANGFTFASQIENVEVLIGDRSGITSNAIVARPIILIEKSNL